MQEKRFHLPDQETYRLSGHELNKLLQRADGNAALTYLYILREQGNFNTPSAMEALRLSEQEVFDAVRVLVSLGLLSGRDTRTASVGVDDAVRPHPPQAQELPQYTAAEIEQEITTDPAFTALVKEVGGILGKILTAPDLNILMGIYRHLGFPPEVTYQLVSHLTKEHRVRYGEGKSPTLRGIEKVAYLWARDDITTLDAAMAHIARREQAKSEIGRLKKAMDLGAGRLSPTQEKYLFTWLDMGFAPEVVASAYDKTVVATGALKWAYMNAILTDWHKKGLHTMEALESAESSGRPAKKRAHTPQSNAPDRQEIARKRRLLEEMK